MDAERARRLASALALGLALSTYPALGTAQTILNTERFQVEEVQGPHLSGDISLSLKRGNADVLDLSTSGMVGTINGRHWPRAIFGGRYLSDEEASILNDQFLQLRYSYILSPETRTFHFLQVQKNQTLLLDSRWLAGSGIRRTLVETEAASLAVGTGIMAEWERLDPEQLDPREDSDAKALRVANLLVLSWDFDTGARILNILYVQPELADFGDVRVLNDLGLSAPLTDLIRATISLEWRRDSRPPAALSKDDLSLSAGFAIEIR